MKNYLLLWGFCWISVIVLLKSTKSECQDSNGEHCEKTMCDNPGIANHCMKTCGKCDKRCPDGYYKHSNGLCVTCEVPSPIRTVTFNISCKDYCPRGRWGPSCTYRCSRGCLDNKCLKKTGSCDGNCILCYEGTRCDQVSSKCNCVDYDDCTCNVGYYGQGCNELCPFNCVQKACNNESKCTVGCNAGWYGPKCDRQCLNCFNNECSSYVGECTKGCNIGYYSLKCNKNCSKNCLDGNCTFIDGKCIRCLHGHFGDKCDKQCPENCRSESCDGSDGSCSFCELGFYGSHCNMSCSDNCADSACDQHSGSCQGCKIGYRGPHCNTSCPDNCTICDQYEDKCSSCSQGWFGNTCHKKCDTCLWKECNITGTCLHGCKNSWFGNNCEKTCISGCTNNTCDRYTGRCTIGCKATVYGVFCNNTCNEHCYQERCRTTDNKQTNPICTVKCKDGWRGDYCDVRCPQNCLRCDRYNGSCLECEGNRYGKDCNETCSKDCINSTCNMTGFCTEGCKRGSWGSRCDDECPQKCLDCDRYTGDCLECEQKRYGDDCKRVCSNCSLSACNMTGFCTSGCNNGTWGPLCKTSCPQKCLVCNRETGLCDQCEELYYGHHCKTCSSGCRDFQCNMTGFCTKGCQDGSHGETCEDSCGCRTCEQLTGECLTCLDGWEGHQCQESTKKTVVVLWVVVPCFLIILLLIIAVILFKREKEKKPHKMKRRIYISTGSSVNLLSVVNQSYVATPRGSSTPAESDISESQPLTGEDSDMIVQLRDDVRKKEDPFCKPARLHPHIFSSYIPSALMQEEVGRSDRTPSPCHVPEEPQLGCVWSTEVQVENFREYVQTMKLNLGLANQFFDLPYGQLGPCEEGSRPANAFKNRYRNILPYDHSRVKLEYIQHIPCSDYINANYIHGYGKSQAFVATQGPFGDVMWDFWRMIWELDTGKIVMLTNFVENRKRKCEQYWPDVGQTGINYDGIVVQCVSEKTLEEYTLRTFSVQMEEQQARTIKQYHFTAWPDKGVPRDVTSLVEFHQFVKKSPATRYGPIIVHCSAGVGRTGTFLALDYLIAQARAEGVVDVYECVTRLRHQRMDAIQTEEQYIFLHDALVEALPSSERPSEESAKNLLSFKVHKKDTETVRNPFIEESQTAESERYHGQSLQDIPLDTFTALWTTTQDRRS